MPSTALRHRITLLRPGAASLTWLAATVRELKNDEPLRPLTIAAPSPYLLAMLRQRLAEDGCANVRLRVQLRPIAERIARVQGSRAFDRPLTGPLESAAIRVAIGGSSEPLLQRLAGNRALQESLGGLFRDLGHLDQTWIKPVLDALARGGSVGAAARRTFTAYRSLTREFPDVPRQLRIAARCVRESTPGSPWVEDLGPLLVYLPPRLDAAERELLSALAEHIPLAICLPWLDDAVADALMHETASALAAAHALIRRSRPTRATFRYLDTTREASPPVSPDPCRSSPTRN